MLRQQGCSQKQAMSFPQGATLKKQEKKPQLLITIVRSAMTEFKSGTQYRGVKNVMEVFLEK